MRLSCLCVTFGRVARLQEAICCFLNQSFTDSELLIYNTCPEQKLSGDFDRVRIINCANRPKSLGRARNEAIAEARGDIIVTFDDDDLYGRAHLDNYAKHFTDGVDWVWLDKQFFSESWQIKKVHQGQLPCFAFTKAAWSKIGGYNEALTVGEDRQFTGKLTAGFNGVKTVLDDRETTYIYCWNNQTYHVSGEGEDRAGRRTAHDRIADDLRGRFSTGSEPRGNIALKLELKHNPDGMILEFLERRRAGSPKKPVCIIQLGRFGDICNILPVCKHIAENYDIPHLMVSREFASILEGVSYVKPEIVDFDYSRLGTAISHAAKQFPFVIRAQIYGKGHTQHHLTPAYNVESWRECGFESKFNDPSWRLVFDNRNLARENALYEKLKSDKPMLLVQTSNSVSSPWAFGVKLLEIIRQHCVKYNIVDIASLRCERIYDVLGMMDRAAGLVSCDTAMLHIAAASSVPVIALVNPQPWSGSILRCNCVLRKTYAEAEADALSIINSIQNSFSENNQAPAFPKICKAPNRRVWHSVERHEDANPQTIERKKACWKSWDILYESGEMIPAHLWNYPRNATDIGDSRALPYLKDVLKHAMNQADDEDIICWTNDDNFLHPELPAILRYYVSVWGVVCSQRCEFRQRMPEKASVAEYARRSENHMGRDLFAATKTWLVSHWEEIPDFILGASDFDLCLAALVRLQYGTKTDRKNIEFNFFPSELPRGYISHQYHPPRWNDPDNEHTAPSQIHNRGLWREWARTRLPDLKFTAINTI